MLRVLETAISIVESVSRTVNAHMSTRILAETALRVSSSVVDLRALELVGIIDVDALPFGEEINGGNGGFAVAIASLLGAAKRQMGFCPNRGRVNVDDSGVQVACRLESAVHVSRVNRSGKTVSRPVRNFDGLAQAADRNHRNDRAEDFFLGNAHVWRAVAEDRGGVEPAFVVGASGKPGSSRKQPRAFVLAKLHVALDRVQLALVDERSHFRCRIQAVSDF